MQRLSNIGFLFLSFEGVRGTFLAMKKFAIQSSQTFPEVVSDYVQLQKNVKKAREGVQSAEDSLQEAYEEVYHYAEFKQAGDQLIEARANLAKAEYEKARGKVPKEDAEEEVTIAKAKMENVLKTLPETLQEDDFNTRKEKLLKLQQSLVTADRNNAIAKAALDRYSDRIRNPSVLKLDDNDPSKELYVLTAIGMEKVFKKTQDSSQSNGTSISISVKQKKKGVLEVIQDKNPEKFGDVRNVLYRFVEIQDAPQKEGEKEINGIWFRIDEKASQNDSRLQDGNYVRVSWDREPLFRRIENDDVRKMDPNILKEIHETFVNDISKHADGFPIDFEKSYTSREKGVQKDE